MIRTDDGDRFYSRRVEQALGGHFWRRIHVELSIPYLFVSYQITDGKNCVGHSELFWEVDHLLNCCSYIATDQRIRISQIALISPSWMNSRDEWQMDTVREIWRAQSTQGPIHQYLLSSGQRLADQTFACELPFRRILAVDGSDIFVATDEEELA